MEVLGHTPSSWSPFIAILCTFLDKEYDIQYQEPKNITVLILNDICMVVQCYSIFMEMNMNQLPAAVNTVYL